MITPNIKNLKNSQLYLAKILVLYIGQNLSSWKCLGQELKLLLSDTISKTAEKFISGPAEHLENNLTLVLIHLTYWKILKTLKPSLVFFMDLQLFLSAFRKLLLENMYVNLACFIIWLWSPVEYSYLSILPEYNTNIFATYLFTYYHSFWSLIFLSIVVITFHIVPKRLCLEQKGLPAGNIVSLSKKEHGSAVHFTKLRKNFKINTRRMINCNLLKLSLDWKNKIFLAFQKLTVSCKQ